MKRFAELVSLLGLLALVLGGGIDFLSWEDGAAWSRLDGRLARIGVQFDGWGGIDSPASDWQGRWVWTDDPAFLARVEAWLPTLKRPACENALRQLGRNRLVLVFQDGRQEEMSFLGPHRPGSSAIRCYDFIWDGHGMINNYEPFSEFLWRWSPGPNPNDGAGDSSKQWVCDERPPNR
jgi:hypothetical protein